MAMQRRTVKTIKETMEPKEVFDLITSIEYEYPLDFKPAYPVHDRAGMSLSYLTIGRVTEIFGRPAVPANIRFWFLGTTGEFERKDSRRLGSS